MASPNAHEYVVERSTVIDANPETVHALINDLHHWTAWSPWEGLDPDMRRTYTGADSGVGAAYAWQGNRKAGAGSMLVTESMPGEKVVLDLEFVKPFRAQNTVTFLLAPHGEGTEVRWRMVGKKTWFVKFFGFVMSMDKMVGKDFEKGLAQLKAEAEKR
ncbi:MAG: SRPBCC family protein [Rhodococcus sp. (in: high G+C Gram-positive bacteria)]|uniref:SRPBCC family protein n=1 Tax=Rhodococcus sp. TaxID=1831 RepID=UPI003BAFF70E